MLYSYEMILGYTRAKNAFVSHWQLETGVQRKKATAQSQLEIMFWQCSNVLQQKHDINKSILDAFQTINDFSPFKHNQRMTQPTKTSCPPLCQEYCVAVPSTEQQAIASIGNNNVTHTVPGPPHPYAQHNPPD